MNAKPRGIEPTKTYAAEPQEGKNLRSGSIVNLLPLEFSGLRINDMGLAGFVTDGNIGVAGVKVRIGHIYVDHEKIAITDFRGGFNLPASRSKVFKLDAEREGFLTVHKEIEIDYKTGDVRILEIPEENLSITDDMCVVEALIHPDDAAVYLDGNFLDSGRVVTKDGIAIKNASGTHRVGVIHPAYNSKEAYFTSDICGKRLDVILAMREKTIYFFGNSAKITDVAKETLDKVALNMKLVPELSLVILADLGSASTVQQMHRQRSEAAKEYLINKYEIDPGRIKVESGRIGDLQSYRPDLIRLWCLTESP
jgi:hypothetical protein